MELTVHERAVMKQLETNLQWLKMEEAYRSFPAFRAMFLPQPYADAPMHQELMEDLAWDHQPDGTWRPRHTRLVRATPRGFAKTTISGKDYLLWLAETKKTTDILYLSDTEALAIETLDRVKRELTTNLKIVDEFGNQASDSEKWQSTYLVLPNGVKLRGRGKGHQIRGFHPRVVILDDPENDENVRSDQQRTFLEDWFFKALLGAIDETCQLVVLGTIIHPLCLLQKLVDRIRAGDLPWNQKVYRADIPEEGSPTLWPARWSREQLLARRRELGVAGYASEYLNDPISVTDPIIQKSWIQYGECPRYPADHPKAGRLVPMHYYTTWDPAISKADGADETAKVTVGVVSEGIAQGQIVVMEAAKKKVSLMETVQWAMESWDRWHDRMIGVEAVAYQKALKETILLEGRKRGQYLPVIELQADKDKVRRLKEVSPLIESGAVVFQRGQDTLVAQLLQVSESGTSGDDDLVDALVYALRLVQAKPVVSRADLPVRALPTYEPAWVPAGYTTGY